VTASDVFGILDTLLGMEIEAVKPSGARRLSPPPEREAVTALEASKAAGTARALEALRLSREGLSLREIGERMGFSPQRASELVRRGRAREV